MAELTYSDLTWTKILKNISSVFVACLFLAMFLHIDPRLSFPNYSFYFRKNVVSLPTQAGLQITKLQ